MNRQEALSLAPLRFGSDVMLRERACTPLSDSTGKPVQENGHPICSGRQAHGVGCAGGFAVFEVVRPNADGSEITILGMGNDWESAFAAVR